MEVINSLQRSVGWLSIEAGGASGVRRCIRNMAIDKRLADAVRDRALLVGSEMATNLTRHAQRGEMFITNSERGYELMSLDHGPGIEHLERALREGFSTAGGLGDGLAAMQRQADALDIQTGSGGTIVRARVGAEQETHPWAVVERAFPPGYERQRWFAPSGDGWLVSEQGTFTMMLMVDALGHGSRAASAKEKALGIDPSIEDPREMLQAAARAVGSGRGAVAGAARIDHVSRQVEVSLVGNISARIQGPSHPKRFAAKDGMLGPNLPTLRTESAIFPPGHSLIFHTDGVSARRPLKVPANTPPWMHAAQLYRAGARYTDDVCVWVMRLPEGEP